MEEQLQSEDESQKGVINSEGELVNRQGIPGAQQPGHLEEE